MTPSLPPRILIFGLGLMGGSLALALRDHCETLLGVDRDPSTLAFAREREIVDHATDDLSSVLPDADLIVLAAPTRANLSFLAALHHLLSDPVMLLDLSSTKAEIVASMNRLPARFAALGGHPMCGKETSGIRHADATLFREATFVLTPTERATPALATVAEAIITVIGARPRWMNATLHDRLVALTSHLPYLASIALLRSCLTHPEPSLWEVAASGFRDTTRLAASDLTMMLDILMTNRRFVIAALQRYRAELDDLLAILETGEEHALRATLAPAQRQRAHMFTSSQTAVEAT